MHCYKKNMYLKLITFTKIVTNLNPKPLMILKKCISVYEITYL